VSYCTSPGKSVRTLVTDLCVWERTDLDKPFILTAILDDGSGRSLEERLTEVESRTGWKVEKADNIDIEPLPTKDELFTLRLYDPKRQFIGPPEKKSKED
jgi:hypothetical protein